MVKMESIQSAVHILTEAEKEIAHPAEVAGSMEPAYSRSHLTSVRDQLRKIKAFRSNQKKYKRALSVLKS